MKEEVLFPVCLFNETFLCLLFSRFMMQLSGALILFMSLTTACGLRCYTCTAADPKSCTDTKSCPVIFNRCFSLRVDGYDVVTKGCQTSIACVGAVKCCEGNLCNSAKPTGSSVILLFASSAIITLFL
ncbi:lymphocyte antigen 6G-like [Larimichthys crocea]|uniref:lymphocyte antigen 6G-like n=1 Tax=Larimichthys crocea TaxID=215358 RepID=UPI00054C4A9B|nr:lymphocyte antigen 6G-like [Larimichthys crocea]